MVDKLRDHLNNGEGSVDMLSWIGCATMDIIGAIGFGHDFQCGESPEARAINEIWEKIIITSMDLPAFVAPLLVRIFPWILNLPVPAMQSQDAIKRIVRSIASEIIQNREATQEKPGKDILSTLLKMKDTVIDLDNMLDQANTFL